MADRAIVSVIKVYGKYPAGQRESGGNGPIFIGNTTNE
jgi:hypothetical protein